jgi:hypothetical protein
MASFEPMTTGPISELIVPYDAGLIMEKVNRRRRLMRGRLVSLGLTIVFLTAFYLWQRDQLQGVGYLVLFAFIVAVSVVVFVVFLLSYLRAKKELSGVGSGTAVRMGRPGVEVAGLFAPWSEVVSLGAVRSGFGRPPVLRLTTSSGGQASVSFDQIPTFPATLDTTARAFSGGRHGVDLTALDN